MFPRFPRENLIEVYKSKDHTNPWFALIDDCWKELTDAHNNETTYLGFNVQVMFGVTTRLVLYDSTDRIDFIYSTQIGCDAIQIRASSREFFETVEILLKVAQ